MSDCVYLAWAEGARELGIKPRAGSRHLFDLARSLAGESGGLWGGAVPVVVGLLCRMNGLALRVEFHPWFDASYFRAAADTPWQRWAVDTWQKSPLKREVGARPLSEFAAGRGAIHLWLA